MHFNTLIEKCLKGTFIEQQWDNHACTQSHQIEAASELTLYHSLVVNTSEYLISHTVYRTIIALIIAVVKVNYVH